MESMDTFFYLWKTPKRRLQLKVLGLETYYYSYLYQLFAGYIFTFIGVHILVMDIYTIRADIVLYIISLLLVLVPLYCLFRLYQIKYYKFMLLASIMPLIILGIADLSQSIMDKEHKIQPDHASYIIYSIYLFMPLYELRDCIYSGLFVTACYISASSYSLIKNDYFVLIKISSECIFLLNINLFGTFLRLLREIAILEIFFGRWELIKQTIMCKYEHEQEKNLLLSVIPANAANDLVSDIKAKRKLLAISKRREEIIDNFVLKPDKLYIKFHKDVSILYADIVNYTYLTTTLDVKPLVQTLHELFVKFDEAAVFFKCLRIKFLGDCYYCVSGIPEKNQNHAKSCVDLGLKMIEILRDVRDRRNLDIDMRIGIHSGNVFAGIIGSSKWQYDIWSTDVEIANKLESTGVAGVHVSQYTLSKLGDNYKYEIGPKHVLENEFLLKNNITETFLIISPEEISDDTNLSTLELELSNHGQSLPSGQSLQTLVLQYGKIREEARNEMAKQFTDLVPIKWRCAGADNKHKNSLTIKEGTLFLDSFREEIHFWQEPDLLLKYSCLTALLTYFGITLMEAINNPAAMVKIISIELVFGYGVIMFWIIILWYQPIWNRIWRTTGSLSGFNIKLRSNILSKFIYTNYQYIISSLFWRIIIYLSVVLSNLIVTLFGLSYCDVYKGTHTQHHRRKLQKHYKVCFNPWFITEAVVLTRSINFLFVQIPYICKIITDGLITLFYIWLIFTKYEYIYELSEPSNLGLHPLYAHFYVLIIHFILLNFMQRQTEIIFKTDFRWKLRLQKKKDETLVSKATAKLLIENILPAHVAEIYLARKMKNELYTEKYENVAIMFATIKNYEIGMVGLRILNKIFCDFDDKIEEFNYGDQLRIEKIKVVGLTYMAACGLYPGYSGHTEFDTQKIKVGISKWNGIRQIIRGSDAINSQFEQHPHLNVFIMLEFAIELMRTLRKFNMEYLTPNAQEDIILRIGISHGEVMGGIVGSRKPFYDVWGNTINMASRMDSTGVEGKIQVTEETSVVLKTFNIKCIYRGLTYVKGRNYIPTYFVGIDNSLQFITTAAQVPILRLRPKRFSIKYHDENKKDGDKNDQDQNKKP